jgi:hypothetical protein
MKRLSCEVGNEFYILFTRNFVEPAAVNNFAPHYFVYRFQSCCIFGSRTVAPRDSARALSSGVIISSLSFSFTPCYFIEDAFTLQDVRTTSGVLPINGMKLG